MHHPQEPVNRKIDRQPIPRLVSHPKEEARRTGRPHTSVQDSGGCGGRPVREWKDSFQPDGQPLFLVSAGVPRFIAVAFPYLLRCALTRLSLQLLGFLAHWFLFAHAILPSFS